MEIEIGELPPYQKVTSGYNFRMVDNVCYEFPIGMSDGLFFTQLNILNAKKRQDKINEIKENLNVEPEQIIPQQPKKQFITIHQDNFKTKIINIDQLNIEIRDFRDCTFEFLTLEELEYFMKKNSGQIHNH